MIARTSALVVVAAGLFVLAAPRHDAQAAEPPGPATQPASMGECPGCKHTAKSVKVVDVESTYYGLDHIDSKFHVKLHECYTKAGWHPSEEKQLDYLVAYNAESGKVTSVKGSMFGKQPNAALLACVDKSLTGVDIGKVRKDPEVHGFAMTVRAEE